MFSIVKEMEQGTEEWLQFRRKHITATDAGKIMQEVPVAWGTPYKCWIDKIMDRRITPNAAMQRGTELEPIARDAYSFKAGVTFKPECVISNVHPWMMASLDGLSTDHKSAIEIKCPGINTHNKARSGLMPSYYTSQLQHQMCVLGLDKMDYVSYFEGELIILTIERDQKYIDDLVEKEKEFYDCVINLKEPASAIDLYEDESSEEAMEIKYNLEAAVFQKKVIEKKIEEYKNSLIEIANGRNIKIDNVRIRKTVRSGSIEYGKVPELSGVDLSKYRKKPTEFYTFRF